jgi:hypothetical protein
LLSSPGGATFLLGQQRLCFLDANSVQQHLHIIRLHTAKSDKLAELYTPVKVLGGDHPGGPAKLTTIKMVTCAG